MVDRKSSISTINDEGYIDGDIRNNKCSQELLDGYKPTKHSYNMKDQVRVFYIKEKKEIMKQEAQKKFEERQAKEKIQAETAKEITVDENFGKKNKNRKGNKTIKVDNI
jgi:hypothetical protein